MILPNLSTLRIRIQADDNADRSYLEQDCFADVDASTIASYYMAIESECECCGTWNVRDGIGGCDIEGDWGFWEGTYGISEVPDDLAFAVTDYLLADVADWADVR